MIKKIGITCLAIVLCVFLFRSNEDVKDVDNLRIHILANSNDELDKMAKYKVRDSVICFLSDGLCEVESKGEAVSFAKDQLGQLEIVCNSVLNGLSLFYGVNVVIKNEYFPARTYLNTCLDAGVYDSLVITLGEGKGDNWWCVMYPPLCFVNRNQTDNSFIFESKLVNWVRSLF